MISSSGFGGTCVYVKDDLQMTYSTTYINTYYIPLFYFILYIKTYYFSLKERNEKLLRSIHLVALVYSTVQYITSEIFMVKVQVTGTNYECLYEIQVIQIVLGVQCTIMPC